MFHRALLIKLQNKRERDYNIGVFIVRISWMRRDTFRFLGLSRGLQRGIDEFLIPLALLNSMEFDFLLTLPKLERPPT